MQKSIDVIKDYATDSLEYGKSKNNQRALKRGNDVLNALMLIEDELKKVKHLNDMIHANQRTLLHVEDDFAKRIDPGNYDTLEEWKAACRILRSEINV